MSPVSGLPDGGSMQNDAGGPSALARYLQTLRSHVKLIVACTVVTLAAAVVYVKVAPRSYTATAQVLVNPANSADTVLFSLPVLHSSGDPTQDVLTAASLLTTPQVAQATIDALHLKTTPSALLGKIQANPLDQSDIVSLQATDSDPATAARLANTFAEQAIAVRTTALHSAIATVLPGLTTTVARLPAAERNGTGTLGDQLNQLEQLQSAPDPTISIAAEATRPTAPTSPQTKLSLIVGLFVGLLIGIGAAFAFDALDPRLQREEQIRDRFGRVPVLARIPDNGRARPGPLTPADLTGPAMEQYRTLRATLSARGVKGASQVFLMTGSAPAEGKTTSAINLAAALAQSGESVVLIEADLRRPTIAKALGLGRFAGTEEVLQDRVPFTEALAQVRHGGVSFLVLAAHGNSAAHADRLSSGAEMLVAEARRVADYVIIDSPPITAVVDALPLASVADGVVVVARVGHTRLSKLSELWEMLGHQGTLPTGIVLVGVRDQDRTGYAYHVNGEPGGRNGVASEPVTMVPSTPQP